MGGGFNIWLNSLIKVENIKWWTTTIGVLEFKYNDCGDPKWLIVKVVA